MAEQKAQLLSVKELVNQAIEIYKHAFKKFFWLQFAPLVAVLPTLMFGGLWLYAYETKMQIEVLIGVGGLAFITFLFGIYYGTLFSMAPYILLRDAKPGADWRKLIFAGKPQFWRYVGVSFLYGLTILGGLLLLVVPGIIWLVQYSFVSMLVIFENKSTDAFARSKQLVDGYWGDVFVRMLIPVLISAGFSMINSSLNQVAGADILQMAVYVVSIIVQPIYLIYSYVLYQDLLRLKGI